MKNLKEIIIYFLKTYFFFRVFFHWRHSQFIRDRVEQHSRTTAYTMENAANRHSLQWFIFNIKFFYFFNNLFSFSHSSELKSKETNYYCEFLTFCCCSFFLFFQINGLLREKKRNWVECPTAAAGKKALLSLLHKRTKVACRLSICLNIAIHFIMKRRNSSTLFTLFFKSQISLALKSPKRKRKKLI